MSCTTEDRAIGPSSADSPSSSAQPTTTALVECADPDACTTRQLADSVGVTFGTAIDASHLDEPEYRATVLANFNSITPENELKWASIHPEPDRWNFGPADEIIAFARGADLEVKGHNLLWDQDLIDSTPEWVLAIDDAGELREAITEHITTIMERYRDSVDRWDVVNEPLQTVGADLYDNHFRQVLGDNYIAEIFEIAHSAAPGEKLWLNEATVEYQPDKAAALVALVSELVDQGTPIDGVGIQGHLAGGTVEPEALTQLVADLERLGVEVAITELDVPARDPADPLGAQATTYRQALDACFAQKCREVTTWGFTDRYTWIDDVFGEGLRPLPFDEEYQPKPALRAIRDELAGVGHAN